VSSLVAAESAASATPGGGAGRRSYGRYAGLKVLGSIGSLGFMLVVNFFLFRVLPGDPARTLGRGRFTTEEQMQAFRETY